MSNAHKGSRLLLKDQLVAVEFSTAHFSYLQDVNGIQYGNMIQPTGTPVYTIRQYDGKFGNGIAIEEASSNLLDTVGGNASQDWTKWSHYNNFTYWQTSSQYDDSQWGKVFSGIAHSSNSSFMYDYYPYNYISGTQYSFNMWMKMDKQLTISPSFYLNSSIGGQHNVASQSKSLTFYPNQWQHIDFTVTSSENVSGGYGGMGISFGTYITGCSMQFAYPMFEQKPFPTSYINGSRAFGSIDYPSTLLNPLSGTISFWYKSTIPWNNIDTNGHSEPFTDNIMIWGTPGTNGFLLRKMRSSSSPYIQYESYGGVGNDITCNIPLLQTDFVMITITWDSINGRKLYIDGNLAGSLSTNFATPSSTLRLGRSNINSTFGSPNGIINDLIMCQRELSAEEIMQIYISNKALYNPFDYRAYAY